MKTEEEGKRVHQTVITIKWDPRYVAVPELAKIRSQAKEALRTAYFPDGVPPWAEVTSKTILDGHA